MSSSQVSSRSEFRDSFVLILKCPRALWLVIGAFVIESMAYFGILTLMAPYISGDLGWGDIKAGLAVSTFTMAVTLFMLGAGSVAEGYGLKRAILFALGISTAGRALYCLAAGWPGVSGPLIILSLVIVAIGSGILQPVCYSGVKQYTDEKTSSMGYALIYALMNAGIVGIATLSSWLRPAVQDLVNGKISENGFGASFIRFFADVSGSGIQAVNWACTGVTLLTLVLFAVLMTRSAENAKVRPDSAEALRVGDTRTLREKLRSYFSDGPFSNSRFIFFIFMLLPVRTLFAHQWLTFPQYILRAYDKDVADRMEWLVNWINPAIIFIGVPLVAALTRRIHVYTMMIIGSLVSALPTFLLCGGPNLSKLITYFVIFSIGEALWSARFLEYASELAPPGRVAQYMGLANVPWLLAKGTTGFYSGWMLTQYCPEGSLPVQQQTGTMWFIYGCIAMLSPIGLWMARGWVVAGLRPPAEASKGR